MPTQQEPHELIIAVNGYGAPRPSHIDEQLRRYVEGCIEKVLQIHTTFERNALRRCQFIFMGGYTNRTDRTEANALYDAFATALSTDCLRAHLIESTTFGRANIQELGAWIEDNAATRQYMHVFCHSNRVAVTQEFVRKYINTPQRRFTQVHGVNFNNAPPDGQLHFWIETTAMIPVLGLPVELIRRVLRARRIHVARGHAMREDAALTQ